jgi:hypothetical protein
MNTNKSPTMQLRTTTRQLKYPTCRVFLGWRLEGTRTVLSKMVVCSAGAEMEESLETIQRLIPQLQ